MSGACPRTAADEPGHWIPAEPLELRRARRLVDSAGQAFGLDSFERYQLTLAASEALANAIEHGAACDERGVFLGLSQEGDDLRLTVYDCGTFHPPSSPPRETGERGRGLSLVTMLMDEVELGTGDQGTVVRMVKRRPA